MFTIVYAGEEAPESYEKSIYLLFHGHKWSQALKALIKAKYDGVVFIPKPRKGTIQDVEKYENWVARHLQMTDVILAWMPDAPFMPNLNHWGKYKDSGKMVFGTPAQGTYPSLVREAIQLSIPVATTVEDTVATALELLGDGAVRTSGEREVPLFIWRTRNFQQWYKALRNTGNVLEHARVEWSFRVGEGRRFVLFWALHAVVYITTEKRSKTNEVVISRPDISAVVLYQRADLLEDSKIVLVREFRSPCSNESGFVWENPGGSSFKPNSDPRQMASHEASEETGVNIAPERFRAYGARQLVAPLSTHQAYLFAAELSDEEISAVKADEGNAHGVVEETERTYVHVMTLGQIMHHNWADWATLGMILYVLTNE